MSENTIREKTEQVMTPIKAELIWLVILILGIIGAYKIGVYAEKLGDLEDVIFNQQEVGYGTSQK